GAAGIAAGVRRDRGQLGSLVRAAHDDAGAWDRGRRWRHERRRAARDDRDGAFAGFDDDGARHALSVQPADVLVRARGDEAQRRALAKPEVLRLTEPGEEQDAVLR